MRAKITTSLGYALFTAVAVAMASSWSTTVNFSELLQFVVFAAGGMSLFLVTQKRSHK